MKHVGDTSLTKIFNIIKNNFVKKDTLKVNGVLKGDGTGNVTAATVLTGTVSTIQGYYVGTTAPTNTKLLWIDTANGLKYYNGSAWVIVPVAYN